MNKQELINKLQKLLITPSELEGYDFDDGYEFGVEHAISLAEDLDESVIPPELEKPVVPQFVAEWYEKNKDGLGWSLYTLCVDFYKRKLPDDLHNWFKYDDNKPIETLVKMKLFGYEIEKEKLYTVEIPNPNGGEYSRVYLGKYSSDKVGLYNWTGFTHIAYADDWKKEEKSQLTEAEIKQDFAWAWEFAEEVK